MIIIMGILKKIFRKKTIARSHRFYVNEHHKLQAKIGDKTYLVKNISIGGLALQGENLLNEFVANREIEITVFINNSDLKVQTRVVHVTEHFMGLVVSANLEKFSQAVLDYFECEIDAHDVKMMDPNRLAPRKEGKPYWFFSDSSKEVFYLEKDGKVTFFQISYKGKILERNANGKFNIGVVEEAKVAHHKGSDLISVESDIDLTVIKSIIRFLEGVLEMDESHRKQIISSIEKHYLSV